MTKFTESESQVESKFVTFCLPVFRLEVTDSRKLYTNLDGGENEAGFEFGRWKVDLNLENPAERGTIRGKERNKNQTEFIERRFRTARLD